MENVCIHSRQQAKLAADSKIDFPKSYSSGRQEDTAALLENDESMSVNLITEADFIQCAGQLSSLITQMTLMKQNIIACTAESREAFLVDAKKVPQSCEEIAVRKEKGVESQITCLAEIGPQQDKEIKGNHKQTRFFSLVYH